MYHTVLFVPMYLYTHMYLYAYMYETRNILDRINRKGKLAMEKHERDLLTGQLTSDPYKNVPHPVWDILVNKVFYN